MELLKELIKFGLSEKEAKLYVALLELNENTAHHLAKKAGLNRPTAYVVLDSLIVKGLASKYEKKGVAYYVAEDPDALEFRFTVQQQELYRKKEQLTKVLPQLKAIRRAQNKTHPFVRFFEGKESLLAMRNDMLSGKDRLVRMMYSLEGYEQMYTEPERKEAHKRRVENGVKAHILYTHGENEIPDDQTRTSVKIDQNKFPLSADIAIYGRNVRIASLNQRFSGIVLDDPEIAKTLASIFELAWIGAQALVRKGKKE